MVFGGRRAKDRSVLLIPGNFAWTSQGGAEGMDFVSRQFLKAIGVDVAKTRPIMTQGGAQGVILASGGYAKMCASTISASLPAINGGVVRPLAVTGNQRWSTLPDVPTTLDATRLNKGKALISLPKESLIGDFISFVGEQMLSGEALKKRFTFSCSVYSNGTMEIGFYTTNKKVIKERVQKAGFKDVFLNT
jgi:hypothetical protein